MLLVLLLPLGEVMLLRAVLKLGNSLFVGIQIPWTMIELMSICMKVSDPDTAHERVGCAYKEHYAFSDFMYTWAALEKILQQELNHRVSLITSDENETNTDRNVEYSTAAIRPEPIA
jgi:hypothetical protein